MLQVQTLSVLRHLHQQPEDKPQDKYKLPKANVGNTACMKTATSSLIRSAYGPAACFCTSCQLAGHIYDPGMYIAMVPAQVQAELGATHSLAFDVTAACSGFVVALVTGAQFIRTSTYRNVLVIGADALSRYTDWRDRGILLP